MDYDFSSKEELYLRVKPALHSKISELKRYGYSFINELDIWNYLIQTKWSKASDLMLFEVVSDILSVSGSEIDSYVKEDMNSDKRAQ